MMKIASALLLAFCLWALPARAAVEVVYFAGFQSQGVEEARSFDGENISAPAGVFDTVDTPYPDDDPWYLYLPSADPLHYFEGTVWTCYTTDSQAAAWYVRFDGDMTPSPTLTFVGIAGAKDNYHWYAELHSSGYVYVRDSAASSIGSCIGLLSEDTWHLIEAVWVKDNSSGSVTLWIDGTQCASGSGADTYYGATDDCFMRVAGQGLAGTPTHVLVDSMYALYDADAGDLLGDFIVLGPYQPDHATSTSDVGDDLKLGDWEDAADTPAGALTSVTMEEDEAGGKRTDGDVRYGPDGDTRLQGKQIHGASWIARPKFGTTTEAYLVYGLYNGATHSYTTGTDPFQFVSTVGCAQEFVTVGSAYCPDDDDDFVIGLSVNLGETGGATAMDLWAMLLVTRKGFTPLVNAPLVPGALVHGGGMP